MFIVIILIAAFVTPQTEGYGNSVASVAVLALSGHWLTHNVIAFRFNQIDLKGFVVKRDDKPSTFWLALFAKAVFSILFMYLVLR